MNRFESNDWLSLSEYSSEYGMSISTLRRRIKTNKVQFKQIHGKYYLPKQASTPQLPAFAPVPANPAHPEKPGRDETISFLLDELKKAYAKNLKDKEDQIIQLKQQIADLKTLIRCLEWEDSPHSRNPLSEL